MAPLPARDVPLIQSLLRWFKPKPVSIDDDLWQLACRQCPLLDALEATRATRLRSLVGTFLQHKTITPVAGLELDDTQRLMLAALCCLPLIEFGEQGLHGWSELVVYPEAFRVPRDDIDEDGVLHQWEDGVIGESWDDGPLILSWADVQAEIADPHAGFCVAVHEMAHKIDALDGAMDGTPPLPRDWQKQWAADFQQAYDAFRAQVDADQQTLIDPYAAEAPEEFFAVLSECHFSAPDLLQQAMPAVAAHLRRFYGPSGKE